MNKSLLSTRNLAMTAVSIAFCLILPMLVRIIPNGGVMFSPMHIPVLIAGLTFGWPAGLITGIIGPLLSSVVTSMPPTPVLPGMMVELAVYGFVTGRMINGPFRNKRSYRNLYISLLVAMLVGRVAAGLVHGLLFSAGQGYSLKMWVTSYFISSFPAIVIQLLIIPSIVMALTRAGLAVGNQD